MNVVLINMKELLAQTEKNLNKTLNAFKGLYEKKNALQERLKLTQNWTKMTR